MRRLLFSLMSMLVALPAYAVTVERVVSPGGIEAWLVQDHLNPIIDLEVSFAGGASADPAQKSGLSSLTAALLDEGAGPLSSQAFQAKLEDLAIELSFDSGKDNFRGHLKTLVPHRDEAFDLFRLSLTQARFDAEAIDRIKAQTMVELSHNRQDPDAIAAKEWFHRAFPNHPYGVDSDGDEKSVKAITKADLKGYVARTLARDSLTIGVTGDITPEQLGPLLDRVFGSLPAHHQGVVVTDVAPTTTFGTVVIKQNIPQSIAIFGKPGIKRDDPDWFAALVMNYMLGGGGFSSWLTEEVREKRGLAYSVYTQFQPLRHSGLLVGAVATRNEKLAQSLEIIKQQFARMRDQGPSEQELEDAKTYLIGSFPLQLDSTAQVASLLVQLQLDHLGTDYLSKRSDYIRAVTRDDVMRTAKRLLDPSALGIIVVGSPEGLAENR
jgi:zinc protease